MTLISSMLMVFWLILQEFNQTRLSNQKTAPAEQDLLWFCLMISGFGIIAVVCQNLVMWWNFGIPHHNEFYHLQTEKFKMAAFAKVAIVGSFLAWISIFLFIKSKKDVNWMIVFTLVVNAQVLFRRCLGKILISTAQIIGIGLSFINLVVYLWGYSSI